MLGSPFKKKQVGSHQRQVAFFNNYPKKKLKQVKIWDFLN